VTGATLCIVSDEVRALPDELHRFIVDHAVSVAFMPTVLAEVFLSTVKGSDVPLRLLFAGGDRLSTYADPGWGFELFNVYGPTEGTVASTAARASRSAGGSTGPPIGRPILGVQAYVVDDRLRPTPIGVPGELCLGGDGLARGYLGRPRATAERFIPNPFSGKPGSRLYTTGDLARFLPDGNLEFLGRIDHQVKVRGYRIEPGEIESVLRQHPMVKEAVVVARKEVLEAGPGSPRTDRRLVAYVVLRAAADPGVSELRRFVRGRLPEYMVPSAFVSLEALPLTPSGKVDRRALPAPDRLRPELARAFVAPRTPTEEVLGTIWAQVLGIDQVGVHDSFFELGGHSLLATQVVSRVRQAFDLQVTLHLLFEAPTVAGMAEHIDALELLGQDQRRSLEAARKEWEF
jgi:acyl-CoA synthetase (AMP-forming)/AMP-acid ligase II/acyl carrier protein